MTFGSFVEIYLKDLESRIKKNTFLTKKHIIETKILPYFGRRKLDEIRTCDVIQWQNEMMKLTKDNGELFSPTYLKTIHNQLSAILNHAVNFYGLKDNVARKAGNMGKEESKEMESCGEGNMMNIKRVTLTFSKQCNMRCPFCYAYFDGNDLLDEEKYKEIIRRCKNLNIETVNIAGGDPLLYKNICANRWM